MEPSDNSGLIYKQQVMSLPSGALRLQRSVGCCLGCLGLAGLVIALLLPMLPHRESAKSPSCLSNVKLVGMSLLQYVQDYDETFPCGTRNNRQRNAFAQDTPEQARYHAGQGWAGPLHTYAQTEYVFSCPEMLRQMDQNAEPHVRTAVSGMDEATLFALSYSYNRNLALNTSIAALNAPAQTVMLTEVEGSFANIQVKNEHNPENTYSPAGNGLTVLASTDGVNETEAAGGVRYATGVSGNYGHAPGCTYWPFFAPQGRMRHDGGSIYMLADGHAKRLQPEQVSPGDEAAKDTAKQDCSRHSAAGTAQMEGFTATFSTR